MLDAYIIEELKRREERMRDDRRPVLEIPKDEPDEDVEEEQESDEEDHKGVIIIDYGS
jgi:hypothetical protein